MPETVEKKASKKQAKNWAKIREISFLVIIVLQVTFFAGTFIGGMWERNHTAEINSVRESAIQSVKPVE